MLTLERVGLSGAGFFGDADPDSGTVPEGLRVRRHILGKIRHRVHHKNMCTFNGSPITLPFEQSFVYAPARGELQIHWNLSSDQQVLAVSTYTISGSGQEVNNKTSLVIDTQTARIITPPISSSHIITSLGDSGLLVGIQGAEIVGYTPNHS